MDLRKTLGWALAGLVLLAAPAAAQNPVSFAGQLSLADDTDLGIGARVLVGTDEVVQGSRFAGSFDWFFPDDGGGVDLSYWEINLNGHYMFPVEGSIDFYAGGGLNIAHASVEFTEVDPFGAERSVDNSDTDMGLNILGGLDFGINESLGGFGELRIELGGGEQFVLTGGLRF